MKKNIITKLSAESLSEINGTIKMLHLLDATILHYQSEVNCGKINFVEAVNFIDMNKNEKRRLTKELIEKVHITKDGIPRQIRLDESKGLFVTKMADKSKIYGKTLDVIYEKLMNYYGLELDDTSFKTIFEKAVARKAAGDNLKQETINDYPKRYKRFISDEFGARDVKTISIDDLKAYSNQLVNTLHPTEKAFKSYKGILNLAFEYACEKEILAKNPAKFIDNKVYYKSCKVSSNDSEKIILSEKEIQLVRNEIRKRMKYKKYRGYYINGYAILLAIETGMRAGELPSLKWTDIHWEEHYLHIHSQQCSIQKNGGKEYYYEPSTKNERRVSKGGRKFPLTDVIRALLMELQELQKSLGITSEYVFCHPDGEWIKTDAYETCLRRLMEHLGFNVTNNHALRKSLNSNIFIAKLNFPVTKRAYYLGHSVETNLKYYSFVEKDSLEDDLKAMNGENSKEPEKDNWENDLKALNGENNEESIILNQVAPESPLNDSKIISFEKKKSLRTANS